MLGSQVLSLAGVTTAQPAPPFAADVERAAQNAVAKKLAPGMAIAVVRDGAVVYERGFGAAGPGDRPVTGTTRFAIGSLTKQFTAVAVLLLVREGKVSLDDYLAKFVPALPNATTITIRELLNQTSGLHNYPNTLEHAWPLTGPIDPQALFSIMAGDASDFPSGTRWAYSNTNYAALAGVVAKASGTSYADYLRKAILQSLGMSASGSGFTAQQTDDAVPADSTGMWLTASQRVSLDLYYGAGSMISTAHDLALWDRALLGNSLLDAASRATLWQPGKLSDGTPTNYAMGFVPASIDGHAEVWHNGYTPGAGGYCYNALFPADRLGVVVLTNSGIGSVESVSESIVRSVLESYSPATHAAANAQTPQTTLVRLLLKQLRTGTLDRTQLTPEFDSMLTPELVAQVRPYFETLGEPSLLALKAERSAGTSHAYRYRGTFADGSVHDVILVVDGEKVSGFQVPP
jgi:CubicO group peptidase (beta-lactamase class C family)